MAYDTKFDENRRPSEMLNPERGNNDGVNGGVEKGRHLLHHGFCPEVGKIKSDMKQKN